MIFAIDAALIMLCLVLPVVYMCAANRGRSEGRRRWEGIDTLEDGSLQFTTCKASAIHILFISRKV